MVDFLTLIVYHSKTIAVIKHSESIVRHRKHLQNQLHLTFIWVIPVMARVHNVLVSILGSGYFILFSFILEIKSTIVTGLIQKEVGSKISFWKFLGSMPLVKIKIYILNHTALKISFYLYYLTAPTCGAWNEISAAQIRSKRRLNGSAK